MNNDLFVPCRKSSLQDTYNCCMQTCNGTRICRALCRNVLVGTVPEDCVAEINCSRPDYVNGQCLEQKSEAYHSCCMKRCAAKQWSDSTSIAREFANIGPVDCQEYCNMAASVLLDKRHTPTSPYES